MNSRTSIRQKRKSTNQGNAESKKNATFATSNDFSLSNTPITPMSFSPQANNTSLEMIAQSTIANNSGKIWSYIAYDPSEQADKERKEIIKAVFNPSETKNQKVWILAKERNLDGSYIAYDPAEHPDKERKEITQCAFNQSKIKNQKVWILAKERNLDGSYIAYDPAIHVDKERREITKNAFDQSKTNNKKVWVLAGERNHDGSYIVYDPAKHAGKKRKEITKVAFNKLKSNNQKIWILAGERNHDGSYIVYDPAKHTNKERKEITKCAFNSSKTNNQKVWILAKERNLDGSYIAYDPAIHADKERREITKNAYTHMQYNCSSKQQEVHDFMPTTLGKEGAAQNASVEHYDESLIPPKADINSYTLKTIHQFILCSQSLAQVAQLLSVPENTLKEHLEKFTYINRPLNYQIMKNERTLLESFIFILENTVISENPQKNEGSLYITLFSPQLEQQIIQMAQNSLTNVNNLTFTKGLQNNEPLLILKFTGCLAKEAFEILQDYIFQHIILASATDLLQNRQVENRTISNESEITKFVYNQKPAIHEQDGNECVDLGEISISTIATKNSGNFDKNSFASAEIDDDGYDWINSDLDDANEISEIWGNYSDQQINLAPDSQVKNKTINGTQITNLHNEEPAIPLQAIQETVDIDEDEVKDKGKKLQSINSQTYSNYAQNIAEHLTNSSVSSKMQTPPCQSEKRNSLLTSDTLFFRRSTRKKHDPSAPCEPTKGNTRYYS